ncbi:hypothetical protein C8J57DRAFT_1508382 [Mycena rebaudengoi]|nr:hypothetical protein C8J57DRAFT_1508382 [Mycena rebaudengoi]
MASVEDRFLYILFLALDACFRLKRCFVSTELKDPGLGTGWLYMVKNPEYRAWLASAKDQKEMESCTGLVMLDYTNTKFSQGYSTMGVVMGVCVRHKLIQANGAGDLQKGERFMNFVSYDIVCIWKKDLKARMLALPLLVRLAVVMNLFRFWAFWNWLKFINMACTLRRRMDAALVEQKEQREVFIQFSEQQLERVPEWKARVTFENDATKPNPYDIKVVGLMETKVHLQFTQEEAKEAMCGVPAVHKVSPITFIVVGLDLEHEQRRVRVQAELKKANTTAMQIDLAGLRMKLNRGILRFHKLQATYMPGALVVLEASEQPTEQLAENVLLMLPSALSTDQRESGCVAGVVGIEQQMRDAQCRMALVSLRNQLHIKSRLLIYKKGNMWNQGANTRSRTIVAWNESKIYLHSEKFQMAWEALKRLGNGDESRVGWQCFKKDNIRCRGLGKEGKEAGGTGRVQKGEGCRAAGAWAVNVGA